MSITLSVKASEIFSNCLEKRSRVDLKIMKTFDSWHDCHWRNQCCLIPQIESHNSFKVERQLRKTDVLICVNSENSSCLTLLIFLFFKFILLVLPPFSFAGQMFFKRTRWMYTNINQCLRRSTKLSWRKTTLMDDLELSKATPRRESF